MSRRAATTTAKIAQLYVTCAQRTSGTHSPASLWTPVSRAPTAYCSRFHTRAPAMAAPQAAETDSLATQNAEAMDITPDSLSETLRAKLGATHCVIEDMSGGCGQAFEAIIVSPQFEKKTSLARHRLVNGALKQEIAAIHAWTPKCYTPQEWEKKLGA